MNSPYGIEVLTHVSDRIPSSVRYAGVLPSIAGASLGYENALSGSFNLTSITHQVESFNGVIARSYFNDFYNTIHVQKSLNLGNILTSITRPLTLWNSYLESKPVTSFVASSTEGFGVSEPKTAPFTLLALEELEYSVGVSENGPPSFNDSLIWVIDGEQITVSVTGNRVVLWGYEPNWSSPIVESLSWKTSVNTSYDQTEQRAQLRARPRKRVEYNSLFSGNELVKVNTLLFGWQNRIYAVPVWQDESKLTSNATLGDRVISLDTLNRAFTIGKLAVIFNSNSEFEVIEVVNKADGNIEVAEDLEFSWSEGTKVYPLDLARANQTIPYQHPTDSTIEINMEWYMIPGDTSFNFDGEPAATTFNSIEVIDVKPNWGQLVNVESTFNYEVFDSEIGLLDVVQTDTTPSLTYGYEWVFKNKVALQNFRALLDRIRGRLKPFFIPTHVGDLVVSQELTIGTSAVYVKNAQLARYVNSHPVRKAVMFMKKDGSNLTRGVLGITRIDDETEVVSLDSPFPETITLSELSKVSFLHLCRLVSDEVNIEHITDSVSKVNIQVRTLKQ